MIIESPAKSGAMHRYVYAALVLLGAMAFSALFVYVNLAQYNWLSPRFERASSPTVWGILQRLYLIIPGVVLCLWQPQKIGLQMGRIGQHWRMLLVLLAVNVGMIGGFLLVSGDTPYSGVSMFFNEVVTVPLVEEVMWRGVVFAALAAVLRRAFMPDKSALLAGIFAGVCFGLIHANNALFGYPLAFVALQTVNATVWGIVYGIARARTDSVYPPILMHAAMNLVVVLI